MHMESCISTFLAWRNRLLAGATWLHIVPILLFGDCYWMSFQSSSTTVPRRLLQEGQLQPANPVEHMRNTIGEAFVKESVVSSVEDVSRPAKWHDNRRGVGCNRRFVICLTFWLVLSLMASRNRTKTNGTMRVAWAEMILWVSSENVSFCNQ